MRFVKEVYASQEGIEAHIQSVELKEAQLREFESAVCDHDRMGTWVYVDKIVPKDEDNVQAAAAKKAPPKGKAPNAGGEDAKPTYAKAWLNLAPLMHPGVKTLT